MNINRKQIMQTFIRIMEHISDKDYQKRIWIMGEGPEVDDFDETVCHFFQEGDGIIEEYKNFGLTEHQYQELTKFRDHFKEFSDENDLPEEFIDTANWANIMDSAKEVLKAFNYQSENKKQILNSFLENLYLISNKSYQKRVWINGLGPEVHSFNEAVCDFFDLGEYIFDNYQGYNITAPQQKILNEFREKFKTFSDENDFPERFVDTPEWEKITEMAKEILKSFNYKKIRR